MVSIGKAKVMGARARELLSRPDFSGRVLAVNSNAVYLKGTDAEILWLAAENISLHGRAVLGRFNLRVLQVGMPFRCGSNELRFDRKVVVDLSPAHGWQPPPIERVVGWEIVGARVRQLLSALEPLDRGESLGQALALIAALADGREIVPLPTPSGFVAAALPLIEKIVYASRTRDRTRLMDAARGLVGLGPGLTPSGDDFLGGIFFVAHQLRAAYPDAWGWEQKSVDDLLEYASTRTNQISFTLLRDHAHGQGAEPLHAWLAALLGVEELAALLGNARRVIEIGSTSGWDILAGAMTGLVCGSPGSTAPNSTGQDGRLGQSY